MKEPLFEFSTKEVLNYKSLQKKIKELDPNALPHGLRKGGAQCQISQGVPITTVMKQADWKNINTVRTYCDTIDRETQINTYKTAKRAANTNKNRSQKKH